MTRAPTASAIAFAIAAGMVRLPALAAKFRIGRSTASKESTERVALAAVDDVKCFKVDVGAIAAELVGGERPYGVARFLRGLAHGKTRNRKPTACVSAGIECPISYRA